MFIIGLVTVVPATYLATLNTANWLLENLVLPHHVKDEEEVHLYQGALTDTEAAKLNEDPEIASVLAAAAVRHSWFEKCEEKEEKEKNET